MEFQSLAGLAEHLLTVSAPAAIEVAARHALNDAAKIIKTDAREQIGKYQPEVGNFLTWEPLAESTEDDKARVGAPPDAPLYRFGELKKSFRSEQPTAFETIVGSIDPVMEYHEFGTTKMPPRSVLGPALFKHVEDIQALLGMDVGAVVCGQRLGYRFNAAEGGIAVPKENSAEDQDG